MGFDYGVVCLAFTLVKVFRESILFNCVQLSPFRLLRMSKIIFAFNFGQAAVKFVRVTVIF